MSSTEGKEIANNSGHGLRKGNVRRRSQRQAPGEIVAPPTPSTSTASPPSPMLQTSPEPTPLLQGSEPNPVQLAQNEERYLGGVVSPVLSFKQGWRWIPNCGFYATDRRLICIHGSSAANAIHVLTGDLGTAISGTGNDFSPRTVAWLDCQTKHFDVRKESISAIVVTKPSRLGASPRRVTIELGSGEKFELNVGNLSSKTFDYLKGLMVAFCPEKVVESGNRPTAAQGAQQIVAGPYSGSSQHAPPASSVPKDSGITQVPSPPPPMAPPPPPPPAPPARPATPFCTSCGRPTAFVAQYGRYYCYACARYV